MRCSRWMPQRSSTAIRSRPMTDASSPGSCGVPSSPASGSTGRAPTDASCAGQNRRMDEAMSIDEFNRADREAAIATLQPCVDIIRWCEEIADGRPYTSLDDLVARAEVAAAPFTVDEVEAALAHHPRIGERASGEHAEAAMSRAEQAGVDPSDAEIAAALAEGNR